MSLFLRVRLVEEGVRWLKEREGEQEGTRDGFTENFA